MRKIISAFLFVSALMALSTAHAAVGAPRDTKGNSLNTIDFVGAIPCTIDSSTSTRAVLCGSAERAIVYGIIFSSSASTNFVVLRDTNTANSSSAAAAFIYNDDNGADESGEATLMQRFPVPMRFTNGISANVNAAMSGTGSAVTILYRPLKATE